MPANVENSSGHRTGKGQFSFQSQRRAIPNSVQTTIQLCSFHMLAWLCSKSFKARLQQYVNQEVPDVQAGFRKHREARDQIANIHWIIEKSRKFQENIYFCSIDYAKAFNCVDHNKLWKILKEMGIPNHLTCLLRNLNTRQKATVRTGQGTTDWFKIRKGVWQGYLLPPCLFKFYIEYIMWNAGLDESQAGIKTAGRNTNNLREWMTPL